MNSALKTLFALAVFLNLASCTKSCQKQEEASESVFFIEPSPNSSHKSPVKIVFGLTGKKLRPAGEDVLEQTSGHHHILLNSKLGHIPSGQGVPSDDNNIHFGKAQTDTMLTLAPGKHKLSLQFADGAHLSYGQSMATTIEVTVVE